MNGKLLNRKKNPLIMQPRDLDVLQTVFLFRFLNSGQIKNLCRFNCQKRANDRLRKLFDNGYLSKRLFVDNFAKQVLYFTGPKAAEIITSTTGVNPEEIRKKRVQALKTRDSFLVQFLQGNNVRYSLEIAGRKDSLMKIEKFRYRPVLLLKEDTKLIPNSYLLIQYKDKTYNCFLKIDQSVDSSKKIKSSIENYLDYGLSGEFERQFGFKYFRFLIVCKSSMRLRSLAKIIERITDKSFCWLTTRENISPENILSDIWLRPNKKGRSSLIK